MNLMQSPQSTDATSEFIAESVARQRRWIRCACWGGWLFVVVAMLAVIGHPSFVWWQLERRGWEIVFYGSDFTDRLPAFLKPWFAEHATATFSEPHLSADDVTRLSQVPRLWALSAYHTTISEPAFSAIGRLSQLEILNFYDSQFDAAGTHHLARLPRLRIVNFTDLVLDEERLKGISDCGKLECLRLIDVPASDEDLASLSKLSRLRIFSLYPSHVSDRALEHLANVRSLKTLTIHSPNITDAGVKYLGRLLALENCDLSKCQVTDEGIKEIAATCKSLIHLWLECPQATDAVLTDLASLPRLQSLVPRPRIDPP
ncbi:MAG: hypothetical protein NT013_27630 [Planctomycetia bacterium]|nr:hypothetical protein [Planctomycetia bacterium]